MRCQMTRSENITPLLLNSGVATLIGSAACRCSSGNGFHRCPITQNAGGFGEVALAVEGSSFFISAVFVASYDGNGLTPYYKEANYDKC